MRSSGFLASLLLLLALPAADAAAAGLLVPRDGSAPIGVRSHRVAAVVEEGLAKTTVRQTFVNPGERELEAIYLFPLPRGAALIDVAMEVGGKRLEGLLAERKRARRVYDEIVRGKRDPALVEQIGRNAFRLSVFPVLPGKETVVELTYIERIPLAQGAFRYVYPLAMRKGQAVTEQDFTFSVAFRSSAPLAEVVSETKGLEVVRRGPGAFIASFERMRSRLDHDIAVTARVEAEKPTVSIETFRKKEGEGWFLATVTPGTAKEQELVPRDVILVVDTSGSMSGSKLAQAKASALYLLGNLRAEDRVNVLRFSSTADSFSHEPVPPTKENLVGLRGFVESFVAAGGTALGDAMQTALKHSAAKGRVRTVVLLTDGLPTVGITAPEKIVRIAAEGAKSGYRVFTFGVGDDLNPSLLEGVSRASRGRAEVFRPEDQIEARLTAFLDRTSSPVMANLELTVTGLAVHDVYPRPIPDVYLGEQVVLAGRYRGGGEKEVAIAATVGKERVRLVSKATFRAGEGGSEAAPLLFARRKLDFLEETLRLRSGLSDEAYFAAIDRGAYSTKDEIVEAIIAVSLEHGVQSAYTSFLVLLPEDRRRLDPRDAEELTAALERAGRVREASAPEEAEPDRPADTRGRAVAKRARGDRGGADSGSGPVATGGEEGGGGESPFPALPGTPPPAGGPAAPPGNAAPAEPVARPLHPVPKLFADRLGRETLKKEGGDKSTEAAVDLALTWLKEHQDPTGRFAAAGFRSQCKLNQCDGTGNPHYDVGVTGLATLAFLGHGQSPFTGEHRTAILRAVRWLMTKQDAYGCFGARVPSQFVYNHAIATLAMVEAYGMTGSPFLKESGQLAVDFVHKMQNPYLAWRYGVRPQDNDTSVTAWMVCALASAKAAGLRVEQTGFDGAKAWLEKATEPEYGRAGYTSRGTAPARPPDLMDKFPSDKSESLTAAGLFARVLIGEDPRKSEMYAKGRDLCLKCPPVWDYASGSIDMYYWYFGTLALFQGGGQEWQTWEKAMREALLDNQRKEGDEKGSWDPVGPWGREGGRIYSTALLTMCLESYYRYARIVPDRKARMLRKPRTR